MFPVINKGDNYLEMTSIVRHLIIEKSYKQEYRTCTSSKCISIISSFLSTIIFSLTYMKHQFFNRMKGKGYLMYLQDTQHAIKLTKNLLFPLFHNNCSNLTFYICQHTTYDHLYY